LIAHARNPKHGLKKAYLIKLYDDDDDDDNDNDSTFFTTVEKITIWWIALSGFRTTDPRSISTSLG
jgi:hypothetical protein